MRVVLRADASIEIGTGHVVRQLSLAEELLGRGCEVFLLGAVGEAGWVMPAIEEVRGLEWVNLPRAESESAALSSLKPAVVVVDSYAHDSARLACLEAKVGRVAVILDGPWQDVSGSLGIAPILDSDSPWLSTYRRRFSELYAGPSYVVLRPGIINLRALREVNESHGSEVTVALGGTDPGRHTEWVMEALTRSELPLTVNIVTADSALLNFAGRSGQHNFVFHEPGSAYSSALASASLVIAAGGTSALELIYLGIPSIFVPVAENQFPNAEAIDQLGLGTVVWPGDTSRREKMTQAVECILGTPRPALARNSVIDGFGAQRVADIILAPVRQG
jgi:spore coat polysaccharide biosynthesis predicted glycosyltransferase SpsG